MSGNVDHYGHTRAFASREQVLEAHRLGIQVYEYARLRDRFSARRSSARRRRG
ncbi:hypothetical protein AB0C87_03450 [Actinomadura sp. NPDC048021]|uniref:hypothetical protein n=1 Tax=Actinomadura sp. NPDC048021 TaxID=3155385 RepID=UPI003410F3D2